MMSGYFELDSKRALVTAATKGVGAAVVAAAPRGQARGGLRRRASVRRMSAKAESLRGPYYGRGSAAVAEAVRAEARRPRNPRAMSSVDNPRSRLLRGA